MPVAEVEAVVEETAAGLLADLRQLETEHGMSTLDLVRRLKEAPDSLDYEQIDVNGWYCLYLAYLEVASDAEPEVEARCGDPPGNRAGSNAEGGLYGVLFLLKNSIARLRRISVARASAL